MKQKYLVIASAVLLVLAFVGGAYYYNRQRAAAAMEAYKRDRSTFVRPYSPMEGDAAAKVEIVEFFDPACDTCKDFYPRVQGLIEQYAGKVRLYERYAPFHNGSEPVVKLLAAAHMQGKFWPTLEAVFAAQSAWAPNHHPQPELVWKYIGGVGLDIGRLSHDINLPEMDRIVRQDLADARKLNVKATPEFFVNGKPLPTWGWEQLKTLVAEEVSAAY